MAYTLAWDEVAHKLYETGSKRAVLFKQDVSGNYGNGVAWSGLTGIDESPSGADATDLWADDIKYLTLRSAEQFAFTIKAYMYPDEFGECDGTASPATGMTVFQQARRAFGFCYTSTVGNDVQNNDYGEKLHLIYGATASVSSRSYGTINDSPEAIEFSWECSTTPVNVTGYKPTAEVVIDSTKVSSVKYEQLKSILYGDGTNPARLPLPDEIITILGTAVTDATPSDIDIGSSTLTPTFATTVRAYTTTTTNTKDEVTVTAGTGVTLAITANGTAIDSGDEVTWETGNNTISIVASKPGCTTTTTTVTVVKS